MQTPNTLNITVGTDVILNVTLEHEGVVLNPALIDDLQANLITGLGRKTPLETSTGIDYIVVNIPWVDGRLPGCYSLEITGSINDLAWSAVGKSIIRYTSATEIGRSTVDVSGDSYDVTMEVGYYFTDSPIEKVKVTVDDQVGEPYVETSYIRKELKMDFHNMKGETGEQGIQGIQGIPGESAVFDPTTGNVSVLVQTTGDSITNPMSQKAVTDELVAESKAIGEWEEVIIELELRDCMVGNDIWNLRSSGGGTLANKQRHSVITVTPGENILLTCLPTGATSSRYAWLSEDYDTQTRENDVNLPLADPNVHSTSLLAADGEILIVAPSNAKYLALTRVDWNANSISWRIKRRKAVDGIDIRTQKNTSDIDACCKYVDHAYDVELADGFINGSNEWEVDSQGRWKGRLILASQYVGRRVRIRTRNITPTFAFLQSKPSGSTVSFCEGWNGLVKRDFDGIVPADCNVIYVYSSSNSSPNERTPYVETHESLALDNFEDVFTPTEKIDISELTEQLCSIGAAKFYMDTTTNEQRHIAIPVTPGETYRVRSIDGYGQMIVATSAYDNIVTFQNNTPIPTATGWNARVNKQEDVFTAPPDGAYLLLTTVNGAGIRCTYEIEMGSLVDIPSKDLSSNVPVKLRVITWNLGGFTKGKDGGDQGYNYGGHEADFYTDLPVWKDTINDMDADIICCCEYNKVMLHGTGGEPDVIARDEIFGLFEHAYIQPKLANYLMMSIFSHMAAESVSRKEYNAQRGSGNHRYYEYAMYRIDKKDVWVVSTHLEIAGTHDEGVAVRLAQMDELIDFSSDKEYVILCADYNACSFNDPEDRKHGSEEFDKFTEAGFKMANHGYLGDFNTGSNVYSVLDNIIVKGFDVSNIRIYDDPNGTAKQVELEQEHQLSDHAAIGCTLTMLD